MKQVHVTDHALVRWMQRALDINVEVLREQLAELAQPYADIGVETAFVGGVWFVFREYTLVTVTPDKPNVQSKMIHDPGRARACPHDKKHWREKKRRGWK